MASVPHIAVVEDDPDVSRMVVSCMTEHGFEATPARSGRELDRVMSDNKVDLVILDVGLPGEDGLSICRRLRGASRIPIIMVTAFGTEADRIAGLELGADDYLAKPFSQRELVARVRAVMRRSGGPGAAPAEGTRTLLFEGWRLDLARRQLFDPGNRPRKLTTGEFDILAVFCRHPRNVLSRDALLDRLHGRGAAAFDRSIDVQVSRLRRKIEISAKDPLLIKTVRHGGYVFTPLVTVAA